MKKLLISCVLLFADIFLGIASLLIRAVRV